MKIQMAKTAGYCFGVNRAINMAIEVSQTKRPVYTLGPLIHNRFVTDKLASQGIHAVNRVCDIPSGATVIVRTHGIPKSDYEALREKGCDIIDAVCPFVAKIHHIVDEKTAEGCFVIILGTPGHPEVLATQSRCTAFAVVENESELNALLESHPELKDLPVCVVAQTTANRDSCQKTINKLKKACNNALIFDTICNATVERQIDAAALARKSDIMVVVGDVGSSNTRHLFEICLPLCPKVFHIQSAADIVPDMMKDGETIGLTAGASTPDWIIKEVLDKMTDEEKVSMDENFEAMLEKSLKTIHTGEKVVGVVSQVTPTEIHVDLGVKQAGYIPVSELSDDPDFDIAANVKAGAEIECFVMRVNDVEGTVMLSKKRLDSVKGWEKIEAAKELNEPITVFITEENKGGVVGNAYGVRIFIPARQTGLPKDADLSVLIKTKVQVRIIEINRQRRRVVGSIRAAKFEERKAAAEKLWETIEAGSRYKGVVKSITSYGAFVDIGGVDGMVHISELSWNRISHPSDVLKIGDELDVFVVSFDKDKKKISLGHKLASEDPWVAFADRFKTGDVVNVKIVKFMPFGAFAEIIPGVDGLIHISQIADHRIDKAESALTMGQQVDARIVEINHETKKISLSIRALLEKPSEPKMEEPEAEEPEAEEPKPEEPEAEELKPEAPVAAQTQEEDQ